jgi:zinc protease
MTHSYHTTKLANGLTIQLKEIHTAPIISHWLWYRVGSRDEVPGLTGISHWVEHMQFKGTPKFPAGNLDKVISRTGGVWNAFTYLDWTAYFETLPANDIDLAIELESDRMVNSLFEPEEVESERTVIISEREGHENEPLFRLDEAIQMAAITVHPYRNEVIGAKDDLHTTQRSDLYQHYRSYYIPNYAVLAVAGDFDSAEMLHKIRTHYEPIPAGELNKLPVAQDPIQDGEKRVVVRGPGETTFLRLTSARPPANVDDFFAFTVLDSLLTGPSSLSFFGGGGISNKTSRLYRSLVERELAVGVSGGLQATIDPYLYGITATVHPQHSADEVLVALDDEIKRLQDAKVSVGDVERAVKQARAQFAYSSENITNQAFWLGFAEMFAGYHWFEGYLDTIQTVSPADIQRIAQTYLQPERRVIGVYLPDDQAGGQL